jgi:23S rRNA (guanosine2251-2'-O)-methyltransferase
MKEEMVRQKPPGRKQARSSDALLEIYGLHAVAAALDNPKRKCIRLMATANAMKRLEKKLQGRSSIEVEKTTAAGLSAYLKAGTVHQGVLLQCQPLPEYSIDKLANAELILVLDQITDPQNVGSILRAASAFSADAIIISRRHSPPLAGSLAKAACGGLEHVPVLLAGNLSRALEQLKTLDVWTMAMSGSSPNRLEEQKIRGPVALVLGSEDKGVRRLVSETCHMTCSITISDKMESLNVASAASIAMHYLKTGACRI